MPFRLLQVFITVTTLVWGGLSVRTIIMPQTIASVSEVVNVTPVSNNQTSPLVESSAQPSPIQSSKEIALEPVKRHPSPLLDSLVMAIPSVAALDNKSTSFNHTHTPAPIASTVSVIPVLTSSSTPRLTISYQIVASGVLLEGQTESTGETVGELTKGIAQRRGITFVYETSDMGWFVSEIAGVKQNPAKNQYWLYFVNGQLAQKGADQVILQPGDSLLWQLSN